jgi:hypothetical protein
MPFNLLVGFPAVVEGHAVQAVQSRGLRGLLTTMYFDKNTGLRDS